MVEEGKVAENQVEKEMKKVEEEKENRTVEGRGGEVESRRG